MKKKLLTVLVALVLCVSLTAILVACGNDGLGAGSGNSGTNKPGGNAKAMSTTQIVAFSAATTGNMLYSISSSAGGAAGIAADTALTDEEIDRIDEQIAFIESFIGSNPMAIEQIVPVDREGYEYQLKISTTDLAGNAETYTLYFNQSATGGSQIADVDDDDDDDDIDELETETKFTLNGLMIVGEKEFTLSGEKKSKTEGNETETELAIDSEGLNKIELKQESENEGAENEEEFSYKIYSRASATAAWGSPVKSFSLEVEIENGEQEIELKSSDAANGSHRFEKEIENNKTVIKVIEKKGAQVKVIKVKIEDGKYTYYDANGQKIEERVHAPVVPQPEPPVTPEPSVPDTPVEPTPEVTPTV